MAHSVAGRVPLTRRSGHHSRFRRVRARQMDVARSCCRPGTLTRRSLALTSRRPIILFLDQHPAFQQWRCAANQSWLACVIVENLAAVGPFFGALHQTVTHGIQADVLPFAGFAFGRAEFVIVITVLPPPGALDAGEFVWSAV